jgi:hypothetical protein
MPNCAPEEIIVTRSKQSTPNDIPMFVIVDGNIGYSQHSEDLLSMVVLW